MSSRRRRRRWYRDPVALVALLALLAGLGAVGHWVWENHGTSYLADQREAADLAAFDAAHPRTDEPAELRTDWARMPVVGDLTGTWGTLWVPSWAGTSGVHGDTLDARTPIKEGVTEAVLSTGAAGHLEQTELPGEVGNMTLAGHRRTYGDNFLHVDDLRRGDAVVVETADAWYAYEVAVEPYLVEPGQGADVIDDAPAGLDDGGRYLTLVSCHSITDGEWGNDHRMVVHAELVGWLPHDAGIPPQLAS